MRFKCGNTATFQDEYDSLPRVPINLNKGDLKVAAIGLVDSGATVNVLPFGRATISHHVTMPTHSAMNLQKFL